MRVTGNFGMAPATVQVSARIAHHTGNRQVCAVFDNGKYWTMSCRPHVGFEAPLQVVFEPFRDLPEGEYLVTVAVTRLKDDGSWESPTDQTHIRIFPPLGG